MLCGCNQVIDSYAMYNAINERCSAGLFFLSLRIHSYNNDTKNRVHGPRFA